MVKVKNWTKDDLMGAIGGCVDSIGKGWEKEVKAVKEELGEAVEKLDRKSKYVERLLEIKEKAVLKVDKGTQFTVVDVFNLGKVFGGKMGDRRSG